MKELIFSILVVFFFLASCKEDGSNDVVQSENIYQESNAIKDNQEAANIENNENIEVSEPQSILSEEEEILKLNAAELEKIAQKDKEALAENENLAKTKSVATAIPKKKAKTVVKPVVKKVTAPQVTWVETTYSFGQLKEGDKYEHKFKFKNTGSAPLVIINATPSCGCTIPSYPFIPIEPGEEGYIGIIYNSVGKSGRQTPDIKVVTNANPATYTLTLVGEVLSKG